MPSNEAVIVVVGRLLPTEGATVKVGAVPESTDGITVRVFWPAASWSMGRRSMRPFMFAMLVVGLIVGLG